MLHSYLIWYWMSLLEWISNKVGGNFLRFYSLLTWDTKLQSVTDKGSLYMISEESFKFRSNESMKPCN